MTTHKALLILHGKQALNEDVRAAVLARREQGWELAVRVTWEGGDAQRLVNEALDGGYTHIIAGGGDGTLRDVAEAMAQAGTDASLVLMPLGTANDFARAAGVPLQPDQALALLDVPARAIDLGRVGGQVFLNMATGGFGSQVTANTSEELKKVLGGAAYLFTGLSRFSELKAAYGGWKAQFPLERRAAHAGHRQRPPGRRWACAVPRRTGGRWAAGHQHFAGPQEVVGTLRELMNNGWGLDTMFVRARLPWVKIKVAQGLYINLDGEPLQGDDLHFEVVPKALRVHLPPGSPIVVQADDLLAHGK